MSDKIYIFDTTRGDGVPGLPHQITEAEAKRLGVEVLLRDAVANGTYKLKAEPPKSKPAAKEKE